MGTLFGDSFDHYATADLVAKYTQEVANGGTGTDATAIAAVGRRSTSGLRLKFTITNAFPNNNGYSKAYRKVLSPAPSGATAIAGFAFRAVSAFVNLQAGTTQTTAPCLLAFYSGGTAQIWFRLNTNGTISAYRGTTLLGTTTSALTQNVTQYVEVKVVLNGTTGTVTIRVDEVVWLSLTGQNTQNAGVSTWDEIYIGPLAATATTGFPAATEWNYDDLYVADGSGSAGTDFKGDTCVDATFPNANGTTRNLTPSTGTDDFAVVDEAAANGDTDYLTAAAIGDKVTMNFPNAPVAGAQIHAIQVVAQARKVDAGSAGHKAVTRIGGSDYDGSEVALASSYSFVRQVWDVKPSDSTAWTDTDYNAAEFGVKKSS